MASTTYIVHHGYDAEKDDELTLEVGDLIAVSDMSDPGWWVGERVKDGKAGWFPSNFVNPYEKPAETAVPVAPAPVSPTEHKQEGPILARVEYDYEAKEPGELSLEAGRVVTVLESSDSAWWKGDLNGKVGTFPSNYVKLIESKDEESSEDKPTKFRLAAFGVKQGGLGSLFAGGVIPGLKKTGGLKKLGGAESSGPSAAPAPAPAASVVPSVLTGSASKRSSVDEPRSPAVSSAPPSKLTPPVAEEVLAPLINPAPARAVPPPAPVEEVAATPEPRIPSRAKKPKAKHIRALVVYEYTAQEDDEISLEKGSSVTVLDKMGDEGWWSGKNEQGEIGNFPSDFVQEIKEDAVQSPTIASTSSFPTPAVAATVAAAAVPSEEPPKSPVHPRLPVHAPVALPAVPTEPLRTEPVRAKTNETPLTTPPPIPRSSRPPSMIASPTSSSAQLNYAGPVHGGPPLPVSPPRRMSTASRSSSSRVPVSPHQANAPDLPNSDRQFLPDEAPSALASIPQDQEDSQETEEVPTPAPQGQGSQEIPAYTDIRVPPHNTLPPVPSSDRQFLPPITDEAPSTPAPIPQDQEGSQEAIAADHSNRSSYILPTPVSRNRPLPPLARPPSIHQITENKRRSVVLPPTAHLPPVPSEAEEAVAQEPETTLKEEEKEKEPEVEEVKPHQEHEEAAPPEHEGAAPPEHDVQVEQEEPGTVVAPGDTEEHAHKEQQEDVPETATTLDTTPAAEADEETAAAVEEKEPEKPKLPEMEGSGPALSHASRPRPAKGRKPPSAPLPNPETSFVSQLEAEVKAAPIPEERKPESTPASANVPPAVEKAVPLPPPKPIKPIFQKFPTPFAGAQPASVSLRPTGRRTDAPQSPVNSSLESSSSAPASTTAAGSGGAPPPAGGVKSLTSRFGQFQGVPASGNNSAVLELEIAKLRRWMTEELDRVKKELADERESREKLQEEVNQLRAQLMG